MKIISVDTHYLIAIINRLDQWHQSAILVVSKLGNAKLVVTESVLVETLLFRGIPTGSETPRRRNN